MEISFVEDIPVESGDSDLRGIAPDLNFSGSFNLSAWSVTSEPLSGNQLSQNQFI